jgi:hypothetical protein
MSEAIPVNATWAISGNPKNKKRAWIEEKPGKSRLIAQITAGISTGPVRRR